MLKYQLRLMVLLTCYQEMEPAGNCKFVVVLTRKRRAKNVIGHPKDKEI